LCGIDNNGRYSALNLWGKNKSVENQETKSKAKIFKRIEKLTNFLETLKLPNM
jgi:hypothetical protein